MEPTGNGSQAPTILQVVPRLVEGGVERGTIDLARYLTEQGWRALVASAGGPLEAELRALGLANLPMPLNSKNPLVMARNIQRLQRLIGGLGVDLVHARSRAPAWSAYHAARRCGVPFVTTFHSVYSGRSWSPKRRYNAIMTRGERVIAISEYVGQHMRDTYGVPASRVRVIPRGVDLERFDPAAISQERIAKLAAEWQILRYREGGLECGHLRPASRIRQNVERSARVFQHAALWKRSWGPPFSRKALAGPETSRAGVSQDALANGYRLRITRQRDQHNQRAASG